MRRSSRVVALLSCWLLVAALLCACSGAGTTNPAPATEEVAPEAWAERLDRGTVAVAQEDGVYLSWRLLATDAQDVAFDVYREDELVATVDGRPTTLAQTARPGTSTGWFRRGRSSQTRPRRCCPTRRCTFRLTRQSRE